MVTWVYVCMCTSVCMYARLIHTISEYGVDEWVSGGVCLPLCMINQSINQSINHYQRATCTHSTRTNCPLRDISLCIVKGMNV